MTVIVSPSAHAHGEWIAAAAGGEVKYMYKNEDGHVLHMDVEVRPLPGCAERSSMLAVLGRRRISAATARVSWDVAQHHNATSTRDRSVC